MKSKSQMNKTHLLAAGLCLRLRDVRFGLCDWLYGAQTARDFFRNQFSTAEFKEVRTFRPDNGKAEEYATMLIHGMETAKPFKNAELTLQELATELSISPNHLSQVINDKLGQNFFDFINGYRVKEARQALRDPAKQHLTILAIADEVGFNSNLPSMLCSKNTPI